MLVSAMVGKSSVSLSCSLPNSDSSYPSLDRDSSYPPPNSDSDSHFLPNSDSSYPLPNSELSTIFINTMVRKSPVSFSDTNSFNFDVISRDPHYYRYT